jgi:predicted negative regulator of RcsB-dependent stress response
LLDILNLVSLCKIDTEGQEFKGILDRSPASNAVRMELADLYVDQKRFSDAQNQFILSMNGTAPEVRRQIAQRGAQLLTQRGARTEAEAVLKAGESTEN